MRKPRMTKFERELERHLATCAMVDQANKDRARIAELEAALAFAEKKYTGACAALAEEKERWIQEREAWIEQKATAVQAQLDRDAAVAALAFAEQKYTGVCVNLAEAREDAERKRLALEDLLDALGALSNPSELEGWGLIDERKVEILDAARGKG